MNAAVAPRLFYGWIVVGGLSLTEIVSWGILYYGFGVLLPPMQAELGWSRSQLAGAFSTGLLASALVAIPLGRYIDRHGARGVMTLGSCAAAALLLAWSRVETLAGFYAIWIGLGATTAGVLYEPAFALVIAWFVRRRAEALAVITSVGGLASTAFVPIITWLVLRMSWRTALVILAVGLGLVTIPIHAWVVRSRPADLGLMPDGDRDAHDLPDARGAPEAQDATDARDARDARDVGEPHDVRDGRNGRSRAARGVAALVSDDLAPRMAWLLAGTFGLTTLSSSAAAVHAIPFLLSHGDSAERAAFVVALIGAAQVPGRMLFASLMRSMPVGWIAPSVFLLQASGLACFAMSATRGVVVMTGAVLFGAGNGLTTLVRSTLVADWFGSARYGAMSGTVAFVGHLSRAAGPIVAAWLVTGFGAYERMWAMLAVAVAGGAMAILILRPRPLAVNPEAA